MTTSLPLSIDQARELDRNNPLAGFRKRFYLPNEKIYMDGNSLGLLSVDAEQSLLRVLDEWKNLGIDGWLQGERPWFWFAEEIGAMAATLVGARPEEVVLTGTTTVNIHALVSSFYEPNGRRTKILADELNFPSDLYALQGQLRLRGFDPDHHLVLAISTSDGLLEEQDIIDLMTADIALVFLPSVLYRSGQLLDMQRLTAAARERNIPIGFDCSHSVGAVPHYFNDWGVDFALWCSYKYLNGGPGCAAFLYTNQKHFAKDPLLAGWFGCDKNKQFDMLNTFVPANNAGRWQISSPGILGTSPIEGAMKIMLEAGIENIRRQSLRLTDYLIALIREKILGKFAGFRFATPLQAGRRGGHIAVEHPEAMRICQALKVRGIIPDLRPPSIIRFAPVALYNTFEEVFCLVEALAEIMESREYEEFTSQRKAIS
ncbi:MAG TPA: kynureninase [Bacteroidales bacterium]|nr:kynureninase [Bacteroidales bacterium]